MSASEAIETFPCFGADASVIVAGGGPAGDAAAAATHARRRLEAWHRQFSRFLPDSELSRLNADRRPTVPVSAVMLRLIGAILEAARLSGGLVDATMLADLEQIGYATTFDTVPVPLSVALTLAPPRAPAGPNPASRWQEVTLDRVAGTVTRPPGLRFDSGGIAKGLFGDILAEVLSLHPRFAVVCAGDVRVGGSAASARPVQVASPFDGTILHTFERARGGAATSGIGGRSWLGADGRPLHHLLDPATGRPAFTGVVQVTALAPSALEAEVLAKTALLSGPRGAIATLRHGGLVVYDDGCYEIS